MKPIKDATENRLMATSLAVTVVNLGIGAVSRIPAENMSATVDSYTDAVLFKLLVLGANTLVIGLLVGKILVSSVYKIVLSYYCFAHTVCKCDQIDRVSYYNLNIVF